MGSENNTGDQDAPSFIETARRRQIIECAIDAIASVGYSQASIAEIAKRAKQPPIWLLGAGEYANHASITYAPSLTDSPIKPAAASPQGANRQAMMET